MKEGKITWCENVLLVDADYLDRTAFDLIVNFERMINRPLPPADLCRWVDCVALDGGMQPGEQSTQVVFLHAKDKTALEHFRPSLFGTELDGVAFRDNLGEFVFQSFPVEEIVKGGYVLSPVARDADRGLGSEAYHGGGRYGQLWRCGQEHSG